MTEREDARMTKILWLRLRMTKLRNILDPIPYTLYTIYMARIVIAGGGFAGIEAARVIARGLQLRRLKDKHSITIIDKNNYQLAECQNQKGD